MSRSADLCSLTENVVNMCCEHCLDQLWVVDKETATFLLLLQLPLRLVVHIWMQLPVLWGMPWFLGSPCCFMLSDGWLCSMAVQRLSWCLMMPTSWHTIKTTANGYLKVPTRALARWHSTSTQRLAAIASLVPATRIIRWEEEHDRAQMRRRRSHWALRLLWTRVFFPQHNTNVLQSSFIRFLSPLS